MVAGEGKSLGNCGCGKFANSSNALGSISLAGKGGETNGRAFVKPNNPNRHITLHVSVVACYNTLALRLRRLSANVLFRPISFWHPFQGGLRRIGS